MVACHWCGDSLRRVEKTDPEAKDWLGHWLHNRPVEAKSYGPGNKNRFECPQYQTFDAKWHVAQPGVGALKVTETTVTTVNQVVTTKIEYVPEVIGRKFRED